MLWVKHYLYHTPATRAPLLDRASQTNDHKWWRSTVTVTTRYTEAIVIAHSGMVRMTKADLLEEPCARRPGRTLLQTSRGSDPFAEFNRQLRNAVLWRKVSYGTQSERNSRFVAFMLTVLTSGQQQRRTALAYLTACC
jgi:hypothetical protein